MRRIAACALVLAALVVVTRAAPPASAQAAGLRISVYGDSVLLGAAPALGAALAGNDVSIDAREDVSLLGSLGALSAARPGIGDVVVLDLGYNDGPDPAAWQDRIDQALATLDGVPLVIWLGQSAWTDGRTAMNAQLVAAQAAHPNLQVVDWAGVVAAHPEYVYGDGVHLTPAGQQAMADLVKGRVDAFTAARAAATSTTTTTTTTTGAPSTLAHQRQASAADRSASDSSGSSSSDHGDGGWLVAGLAAVVLGVGALVAWRAFRRSDA
jgi:lysophospholipase L1-like esterase